MTGCLRDGRDSAHERAADAENVQMHVRTNPCQEPISKLAAQPDYFGANAALLNVRYAHVSVCRGKAPVSSLVPRCTSLYYLGTRYGPSRTRPARPILR